MNPPLRILIVDDHPIFRHGLRQALEDAEIGAVTEASTPQQALDLLDQGCDVAILDIGLPGRGGLELLKEIKDRMPDLPVLMLSMHAEDLYAVRALRAGASGYLTKEAATDKLIEAVRKISSGGRYVSAELAERLAAELSLEAKGPLHSSLSDRELEVFMLIASGLTVGEIADRIALSVKTVSTYRGRILDKMRLRNNAEIVQYALANKLRE